LLPPAAQAYPAAPFAQAVHLLIHSLFHWLFSILHFFSHSLARPPPSQTAAPHPPRPSFPAQRTIPAHASLSGRCLRCCHPAAPVAPSCRRGSCLTPPAPASAPASGCGAHPSVSWGRHRSACSACASPCAPYPGRAHPLPLLCDGCRRRRVWLA